MAKAAKVPTNEEITEYYKTYIADPLHNSIYDLEHKTMAKEMTQRIFAEEMSEDVRATAWTFCKTLTKFVHAPVSPAEYKRMEKYKDETGLIDVLLKACDDYFPEEHKHFDRIGYGYAIALISISDHRRADCLALLDRVTQHFVSTKDDYYDVLLRNMQRLEKDHPDLTPFKTALEAI